MGNLASQHIKISDIVTAEYEDFKKYCSIAGKEYSDEITTVDYIAYRSQFGRSKAEVKQLRAIIEADEGLPPTYDSVFLGGSTVELSTESIDPDIHQYREHNNSPEIKGILQNSSSDTVTASSDFSATERRIHLRTKNNTSIIRDINASETSSLFLDEDISSEKTYAEIYQIDVKRCENISIKSDLYTLFSISFSIRVINALSNADCKFLKDLVLMTPSQIKDLKNLGAKSIAEIENALEEISKELASESMTVRSQNKSIVRYAIVRPIVESILKERPFSSCDLSEPEKAYLWEIQEAIKVLGTELGLLMLNRENCHYAKIMMSALNDYHEETERINRIISEAQESLSAWPKSLFEKQLLPFIQLFCKSQNKKIETDFLFLMKENTFVKQYLDLLEKELKYNPNGVIAISDELEEFQKWMSGININNLLHTIFDPHGDKELRMFEILYARVSGVTLEELGKQLGGLTRERVRQLESKAQRVVRHRFLCARYNLIGLIFAIRNGDRVLQKEELIESIRPEYIDLLWYCATRTKDKTKKAGNSYLLDTNYSYYDNVHDVLVVPIGNDAENLHAASAAVITTRIANELPDLIKTSELRLRVDFAAKKHDISPELCWIAVSEHYKEAGIFSYKGRLTIVQICDYILKHRFQNGYKIADETDSHLFLKYMKDMFGKSKRTSARAVDAMIMDIGVLADRGKYVHKDYISADTFIVNKIFTYIQESPKSALTYTEIFAALRDVFAGTVITNRYVLQGVMKLFNSPYESHRDYITKDGSGNVEKEFSSFIKANGEVHKSDIFAEFPGWKDYNLSFILQRCPDVIGIDNGYFIHSDTLSINPDVKTKIYQYLIACIQEIPVSTKYLQDEFMLRFPEFMIQNNIQAHGKLYGILHYMFPKEFHFSRPYIARENVGAITNKSVLLQHLEEMQSIEISDFIELCRQNGIHYVSVSSLLDMMQPEFIRVDELKLMRNEDIGITEDMFQDVTDLITEALMAHNGYIAAKTITDFSWYPVLNIEWTPFLLESIANLIPTGVSSVKILSSSTEFPRSIFVSEEYAEDDWSSLLVKILKKEHSVEPFRTKTAVLEWLQSEGLCNVNYPAFLDTENHVYFDGEGKLRIE